MRYLTQAHKNGGWVLLQNIHLTIDWTSGELEKKVDKLAEGAHAEFRLFLSAEPPPLLERPLPISILQVSERVILSWLGAVWHKVHLHMIDKFCVLPMSLQSLFSANALAYRRPMTVV